MSLLQDPRTRRCVSWLAPGVAGAEVVVAAIFTAVHVWGGDWQGYSAAEKILGLLLYAPPAAVYLATLLVELPAVARRPLPRCHTVLVLTSKPAL